MKPLIRRLVPLDLRIALGAFFWLSPRVALFYVRAHRIARQAADPFALSAPTRPRDLAELLKLARGRRRVVELGTGTAWTAIAMVLNDPQREVISYDPVTHQQMERYLSLVTPGQRRRLHLRAAAAEAGPDKRDQPVEFLFVDIGGHSRADTVTAFRTWRDALAPNAVVAFHDYGPHFPGVPMAVAQLDLAGETRGESLFVWSVPE